MKLRTVTGVYPHPNPERDVIAFTRTEPRPPGEIGSARNHLWVLVRDDASSDYEERLVIGGEKSVRGVAWRPYGDVLTFVDKGDGDAHPEVYAIDRDGETQKITETARGVSSYSWRPDGKAIAYTVTDPYPPRRTSARKLGFKQKIVDEDYRHVSLWLWEEASGKSRRLTEGVTVFSFEWAPAGTHLAAGIAPSSLVDDRYMFTRLHLVDPESGTVERLVDNPGKLGDYAWSPDGKTLAYVSAVDRNDPHAGMLYTVSLSNREPRLVTPDFSGMVHGIEWVNTNDGPVLGGAHERRSAHRLPRLRTGKRRDHRAVSAARHRRQQLGSRRGRASMPSARRSRLPTRCGKSLPPAKT